jgi:hypothetical protein
MSWFQCYHDEITIYFTNNFHAAELEPIFHTALPKMSAFQTWSANLRFQFSGVAFTYSRDAASLFPKKIVDE